MTEPVVGLDLAHADITGRDLSGMRFINCSLYRADLSASVLDGATFVDCDMREVRLHDVSADQATFERCDLQRAHMERVQLRGSKFAGGHLWNANLYKTDASDAQFENVRAGGMHATTSQFTAARFAHCELDGAQFRDDGFRGATIEGGTFRAGLIEQADLVKSTWRDLDFSNTMMIGVRCDDATFEHCDTYGLVVCDVRGTPRRQHQLNAGHRDLGRLIVNDIKLGSCLFEVARDDDGVKRLFEVLSTKIVLILGRFTPHDSKDRLDRLRQEIGRRDYIAVVVDWELTGGVFTAKSLVSTVAMCTRFVVADVTDARTVIAEVEEILTFRPMPVQPILREGAVEPHFLKGARREKRMQLLPTVRYIDTNDLMLKLDAIIQSCEDALGEMQA